MASISVLYLLVFLLPSSVVMAIENNNISNSETIKINQADLYGSWQCAGAMEYQQINMKVSFDYQITFTKDYKSSGEGIVSFGFPNYYEIDYKLTDNSTWKINGDEIIYTSDDLQLTNLTYPELEKIVNLEKRVPQRINESSQILQLTGTLLTIKTKSDDKIYRCSKII